MKAHVMQKYGHSIELQMRKEMDMDTTNERYYQNSIASRCHCISSCTLQ